MRLPRLVLPNHPYHLVQSGLNGQPVFQDEDDYRHFYELLRTAARQFKVSVHGWVLLPAQLRLLATPSDETGLARMMQWIGRSYVPYFNAKYGRAGTLWQGRFKSSLVDPGQYFLDVLHYLELAPMRARLAEVPLDYAWSSYAHHAGQRSDPLVVDHPVFWALGNTPFQREAAYIGLVERPLSQQQLHLFDDKLGKGWPLASEQFISQLEQRTKRQVGPGRRGRPPRAAKDPA
ncbi:MAG: transposase [Telluria sp.]